jgi:hypothetical protein
VSQLCASCMPGNMCTKEMPAGASAALNEDDIVLPNGQYDTLLSVLDEIMVHKQQLQQTQSSTDPHKQGHPHKEQNHKLLNAKLK